MKVGSCHQCRNSDKVRLVPRTDLRLSGETNLLEHAPRAPLYSSSFRGLSCSSRPHQMCLDGAPAVHQPVHFGQEGLLIVSRPCDFSRVCAELLLLGGTRDRVAEPVACARETMELCEQFRLIHQVQASHRATVLTTTGSSPAFCEWPGLRWPHAEGGDHVKSEDQ